MGNFSQAGRRMNSDANYLYGRQSYGTASHLYGLSVECAIKEFIRQQPGQNVVPRKHLPDLLDDAKRLMSGRRRGHMLNLISRSDFMAGWEIGNRYWSDDCFTREQCKQFREDSRRIQSCIHGF